MFIIKLITNIINNNLLHSHVDVFNKVVYLEYHLDHLSSQWDLVLFGNKSLEHSLLSHVIHISSHAWDSYLVIALLNLSGLGFLQSLVGIHSWVLCQNKRNLLQSLGKSSYGILLHIWDLISLFSEVNWAAKFWGTSSNNNIGILDKVSDDTQRVMYGSVGLVNDGLASSSDQNRYSLGLRKLLEDNHVVVGGSVLKLFNLSNKSQLVTWELFESGNYLGSSGHCQ